MRSDETIILVTLFALIIGVVVTIFYLLTLQNVLKEVKNENRLVPPVNVWLMFIPFFNLIYPFILYPKISDSIKNEYASRGLNPKGDFSRQIGISIPIIALCSMIPVLGTFASLAYLIVFIIFWVKMGEYKNELIRTRNLINNSISNNPDLLD
jgi:uncharacterized membrane protein YbhN (UPF0104 family)